MIGARLIAGVQATKAAAQEDLRRAHERDQARLADQRALRDAKRERLRDDYVAIAYAADNGLSVSKQLMLLLAGDTPEARQRRLSAQLEEATDNLGRAAIRLKLEQGTQHVLEAYNGVRALWFTYQYQVTDAERRRDYRETGETLGKIEGKVRGLIDGAKADLDRLGEPI
jgi:hypothetical protein